MNKIVENKYAKAFVAGSAFPVVVFLIFYYNSFLLILKTGSGFIFGYLATIIPIILGLINILYILNEKRIPIKNQNSRLWVTGLITGLILSLYGNFVLHIPTEVFLLSGPIQYITLPLSALAYGVAWRYIIKPLNQMLGLSE